MKNNKIQNFKIEKYNQFKDRDIKENINSLIENKPYIKLFLQYLVNNKINFQVIEKKPESFIVLKLHTLESKIFIILLNEKDNKNAVLKFKNLKYFQKKLLIENTGYNRFFLIFLDPSITLMDEIIAKSKFIDSNSLSKESEFKKIIDTSIKISIKKHLREGIPLGTFNEKNKLNDLTGKEWVKFTKSWFVHIPPPRNRMEILHPAKFPESLIEEFINFFTKEGQYVLDPFLGTGSTIVAAKNNKRNCIGIEINKNYADIAKKRIAQKTIDNWVENSEDTLNFLIINDDSNKLDFIWKENKLPLIDFCITSPPYWNQLKRNSLRQAKRKEDGLDTIYSQSPNDIGNIDGYKEFLLTQESIFNKVYDVLKNKGYLVVITNNIFFNGKVYPLAFDTAISLSNKWILKDEKIWCQDDKTLLPLGINNAWVANRCHQYCLIFRKDIDLLK